MSFDTLETSIDSGKPRDLFLLNFKDNFYAYAMGNEEVTFAPLSGSDISCDSTSSSYTSLTTDFTDGLASLIPGQYVLMAGFTNSENNGYKKITSISAHSLVVDSALIDEIAGNTITFNEFTYSAVGGLDRDAIKSGSLPSSWKNKLTLPIDSDFVELYQDLPPNEDAWASIFNYHSGDLEYKRVFSGFVTITKIESEKIATITINHVLDRIETDGLHITYGAMCNWQFGEKNTCKIDLNNHATAVTVKSISGKNITFDTNDISGEDTGYYNQGLIYTPAYVGQTDVYEMENPIMITKSTNGSETITLYRLPTNIAVNDTLYIIAGCNRLRDTCINKFDNLDNFGGFPDIPLEDPYKKGFFVKGSE